MSKVYFTSDLHFGHGNLCRGLRNMSSQENDKLIITNWNKLVTKRDTVIIVGDITMDNLDVVINLNDLNGNKIVVAGNHDTKRICRRLNTLAIDVVGCLEYKGFIVTHIPIHESELKNWRGNIHGHIHKQGDIIVESGIFEYRPKSPKGRYFNVNCEFHDYAPVLFSEIEDYFKNL